MHIVVDFGARLIPFGIRGKEVGKAVVGYHAGVNAAALIGIGEHLQLAGQQHLPRHPLIAALNGLAHLHQIAGQQLFLPLLGRHGAKHPLAEGPAFQVVVLDDTLGGDAAKADLPGLKAVTAHDHAAGAGMHRGSHPAAALAVIINCLVVLYGAGVAAKVVEQERVFPGHHVNGRQLRPGGINVKRHSGKSPFFVIIKSRSRNC